MPCHASQSSEWKEKEEKEKQEEGRVFAPEPYLATNQLTTSQPNYQPTK